MTALDYQKKARFLAVTTPFPDRVVLALDIQGYPRVWAMPVNRKHEPDNVDWIITNDPQCRTYMFKEDGLFGYTEDWNDRKKNTFPSLEEAIANFRKFYK